MNTKCRHCKRVIVQANDGHWYHLASGYDHCEVYRKTGPVVAEPSQDCPKQKLVTDLWWFIENVTDDTPDRTERFFALRERVRKSHELACGGVGRG